MGTLRAGAARAGAGGPAALLVVAETCRCFWRRGWGSTKWQLLTHLPTLDIFFFFFCHFIKLLNLIKHVVYFTSRHLLLSSSSPSQAAERGSHVRRMGALGACRWWGGSLGTMPPAANPRCPGLASGQQGQMDTPAFPPPAPLEQGHAPGPCDPRAVSRVLSHGVWITHFCSAPKITPCRPGRRRGDGPCCEPLALPCFCCRGMVSSHRRGGRAIYRPYFTSRSMGRARLPCCWAGDL